MARISYVNGSFVPHEKAMVPIDDRGLQFADAVYEVVPYFKRRLVDFEPHFARLKISLSKLAIQNPLRANECRRIFENLIEKNSYSEGIIYLQITRGTAIRDHAFPRPPVKPNVIATAKALEMDRVRENLQNGVGIVLVPENRWRQVDIKSTSLLGNVLAKEEAQKAGCYEAVFYDPEGFVTEGTASNAWIVDKDNVLRTRKANGGILKGVTRASVLGSLGRKTPALEEKSFTTEEARTAREFFLTSTTSLVMPVVRIDGKKVAGGEVGKLTRLLQKNYFRHIEKQTGYRVV